MSDPPPPYAPNPSDEKMGQPPPPAGYQQPGYGPPQQPYPQGGPGYSQATPGYPQGPPAGYPPQPGYPVQGAMQPGYPPQPGRGPTTVVIQPVQTTTVVQQYRESPVQTVCPYCQAQIMTAISYDTGTFTWLIAAIVCLVGCNLGCCFIPFCIYDCKDAIHYCPNCQHQIATWTRMCDLGCCFIPFCIDGCKDAVHTCPNCQQQIARWSRM